MEWNNDGSATFWYYWDGSKYHKIGKELPENYKDKEFLIIYPPNMVTERIEKRGIPFPYKELIKYNRFSQLK